MTDTYRLFISDSNVSDPDGDVIVGPQSVVIAHGLTFTGKRKFDYGQHRNTNLLRMLENFATEEESGAPPTDVIDDPLIGQLWYNKTSENLQVFDGSVWKNVSPEVTGADVTFDPAGTNLTTTNIQAAIAELDSRVGNLVYDEENYVTNGPTVTAAINSLDIALKSVADDLDAITPIQAFNRIRALGFGGGGQVTAGSEDRFTLRSLSNIIQVTVNDDASDGKRATFDIQLINLNNAIDGHGVLAVRNDQHVQHSSVSINAGNGLTGGGNIASTRTITLGTPGTLTTGTSNNVTATSHTHQVNFPVTSVNGETGAVTIPSSTDYNTIGSHVWAYRAGTGIVEGNTYPGSQLHPAGLERGDTAFLPPDNQSNPIRGVRGSSILSGTWRALGRSNRNPGSSYVRMTLFVRIS